MISKIAEEKLRLSEEQMRVAQNAASFGHFELNFRTVEFTTSEALQRLLGVEPGWKITFPQKLSRIHPDYRPGVEEAVEQARSGKSPESA